MEMLYTPKPINKMESLGKLFAILVLALTIFAGGLNPVKAQSHNQSDWNVPPPLPPPPPGNAKAKVAEKNASEKTMVPPPADIPAIAQPIGGPVQMLVLAAISTTPPAVNTPEQPALTTAGLPDIPAPDGPDAPALPKQSQQDVLATGSTTDLPLPESPGLPPAPAQPVPPDPAINTNSSYPLITPEVPDLPPPTWPPFNDFTAWSTPAIPESETFKLVKPAGTKAGSGGGKGVKKGKSPSRKK